MRPKMRLHIFFNKIVTKKTIIALYESGQTERSNKIKILVPKIYISLLKIWKNILRPDPKDSWFSSASRGHNQLYHF